MDNEKIIEFVLSRPEIEGPTLQRHFSLSYTATRQVIEELVGIGTLEFISGVAYKVNKPEKFKETPPVPVYVPESEDEKKYIEMLGICVKNGCATTSFVQRKCSVGFTLASRAVDWMEKNGYVTAFPERKITISAEEYAARFGIREEKSSPLLDALRSKLSEQSDETEEDDEDLEISIDELFKLVESGESDEEEDDASEEDCASEEPKEIESTAFGTWERIKPMLSECFTNGLYEDGLGKRYIIGFGNGSCMELKFVRDGNSFRLSDGGDTVLHSQVSTRRIQNLLKDYRGVGLEDNEICVTIEEPTEALVALLTLYAATDAVKRLR